MKFVKKFANMRDEEKIFQTNLERCSYRFLQQTAKAMGLPSNVKKVYLIKLINTKNYGTPSDLNLLVRHIREEQQHHALVRKKMPKNRKKKIEEQSPEISSTSNAHSPAITKTPKRVDHFFIQYSSDMTSPTKYPQTVSSRRVPITSSDRVLRSSNRITKPSYLLNNTLISLLKDSVSDERHETRVKIVSTEENKRKTCRIFAKQIIESWQNEVKVAPVPRSVNILSPPLGKQPRRLSGVYPLQPEDIKLPSVAVRRADGSVTKLNAIIQRPLLQPNYRDRQTQTDNVNRSLLKKTNAAPPVISEIALTSFRSSNICEVNSNLNFRPSVSNLSSYFTFRSSNGSEMTPSLNSRPSTTQNVGLKTPNVSETAQILAYRTSNMTEVSPTNSYKAPNSSMELTQYNFSSGSSCDETTLSSAELFSLEISKENNSVDGEYYHKKIRAEQVRSLQRSRETARSVDNEAGQARLPKINEVFSNFNNVYSGDVTQPLYVQVDNETQIASLPPYIPDPRVQYQGTSTLEKIYNLRLQHQPTLQIATTINTHTVYCTPVISTANTSEEYESLNEVIKAEIQTKVWEASPPHESQPFFMNEHEAPRANDFFSNFHCHEHSNKGAPTRDFQRSCSSVETLSSQEQELGATVTIPEMVEDALEIISQDGDYMERMGMDIRMQCILCNWAGPKIILEYHIRKDHSSEIVQCESNEFSASYTLGELSSRRLWLSHVLQHDDALYVLSAKYEDPDCFMAALSTVSYNPDDPKTGSMTIYNKVTGEPFTWTGVVTDLPPCMPYENDPNCLKLQLSQMDLLPNSANLKLLNRELVIRSPTKVVVGQPELDSIHISLTVKIVN